MKSLWPILLICLSCGTTRRHHDSHANHHESNPNAIKVEYKDKLRQMYFNPKTNMLSLFGVFPENADNFSFATPSCSGLDPIVCNTTLVYEKQDKEPSQLMAISELQIHIEPQYKKYVMVFGDNKIEIDLDPASFVLGSDFTVNVNNGLAGYKKYEVSGKNLNFEALHLGAHLKKTYTLTPTIIDALKSLSFKDDLCMVAVNPFEMDTGSSLVTSEAFSCNNPSIATKILDVLRTLVPIST